MAAFGAMSWRVLPPAGHPIAFAGDNAAPPQFANYRARWVQSGTAALALAMIAARRRAPHIEKPQVILPGYACPDLVAAAVFAGVQPVLADIGSDDPGYDLNALRDAITPDAVGVVAVNFLGVSERLSSIREIISASPSIALIEDNAQWFPEPFPLADLHGDFVCLSFGRGKPVSLLGGGALLSNAASETADLSDLMQREAETDNSFAAKALAYNALLSPWLYGAISRLPFLQLGVTRLKALSEITAMDARRLSLLTSNIQIHLNRSQACADAIGAALPESIIDLPLCAGDRAKRLLRYPVLLRDREARDRVLRKMQRAGLGASALYQSALPDIEGVAVHVKVSGNLEGAKQFAQRLLTLPVHAGVNADDVREMCHVLAN